MFLLKGQRKMKKRTVSLAVVLLLMLALISGTAYADQYMNIGQISAGSYFSTTLASLSSDCTASSYDLPSGCSIRTSGGILYFEGTPSTPGYYSFTISVDSGSGHVENISCSVTIVPATPSVVISNSVSCYVGDQTMISAAASVPDGGSLSYQWYYNYSGSASGGTPISGANGPEYYPDTSSVGITYYYCQIYNSNNGQVSYAVTQPIYVNVTEAVVQSIMVNTLPQKTRYTVGDSLDTNGLSITVSYGNGTQQTLYSGFQYSPSQFLSSGQVNVELTYGGKACSFPVTVLSLEDSITGIGMVKLPSKTEYNKGDSLDPTGLVFRAYLSDGTYTDVDSGYTYSPKVLNTAGTQQIKITYNGKSCTFSVTVKSTQKTENKLEISSSPGKLTYNVGDKLDTSGLVLKVTDSTGTEIVRSGYTCEPSVLSSAGTQTITVRYGTLTTSFTVTVNATATPTPSVSPSVSPSAEVSASPSPTSTTKHSSSGSGSTLLIVIMIIALLCLIGLGIVMMIMNAGGVEQFKNQVAYKLYKFKAKFRGRK